MNWRALLLLKATVYIVFASTLTPENRRYICSNVTDNCVVKFDPANCTLSVSVDYSDTELIKHVNGRLFAIRDAASTGSVSETYPSDTSECLDVNALIQELVESHPHERRQMSEDDSNATIDYPSACCEPQNTGGYCGNGVCKTSNLSVPGTLGFIGENAVCRICGDDRNIMYYDCPTDSTVSLREYPCQGADTFRKAIAFEELGLSYDGILSTPPYCGQSITTTSRCITSYLACGTSAATKGGVYVADMAYGPESQFWCSSAGCSQSAHGILDISDFLGDAVNYAQRYESTVCMHPVFRRRESCAVVQSDEATATCLLADGQACTPIACPPEKSHCAEGDGRNQTWKGTRRFAPCNMAGYSYVAMGCTEGANETSDRPFCVEEVYTTAYEYEIASIYRTNDATSRRMSEFALDVDSVDMRLEFVTILVSRALFSQPTVAAIAYSTPPPPPPPNCPGVAHGESTTQERVQYLVKDPRSDCQTQIQERSCLCNGGVLSCGTWSPNTFKSDTCTSGCGTTKNEEVLYGDFRTMFREASPDGGCVSQRQARGRECVGALGGSEGTYGPYGDFCPYTNGECTGDELYLEETCVSASPEPPPSPPPSPPTSPPPPPPPNLPGVCTDDCVTSSNGFCEDGGDSSANSLCTYGTDCRDCGPRVSSPPPPPPSPPLAPSPNPSPPRRPPFPPPSPGFFDNQTNIIILVSVGGAVALGILLIVLAYVLTPERAKSLSVVLGSIAVLVGRARGRGGDGGGGGGGGDSSTVVSEPPFKVPVVAAAGRRPPPGAASVLRPPAPRAPASTDAQPVRTEDAQALVKKIESVKGDTTQSTGAARTE